MLKEIIFYGKLSNHFNYIIVNSPGKVTHASLLIDTGSADEPLNYHGISHFIEHTIFKGTHKRTAYKILNYIDSKGGDLNAYTSKEDTCIYFSIPNDYAERGFDLIGDIMTNSTFDEAELEKEKMVVLDEILSYLDSPADHINDMFDELIFPDCALGRNILGSENSVKSFNHDTIKSYFQNNYTAEKMCLVIISSLPNEKLKGYIEKYFGSLSRIKNNKKKKEKINISYENKSLVKPIFQDHCVLGCIASSAYDEQRVATNLFNNFFGGQSMNSYLNLNIREKYGLTYNIESSYSPFKETGMFTLYFSTDKNKFEKTLSLVKKEMEKLIQKGISKRKLNEIKEQYKGNILLALENKMNLAGSLAKQFLLFNKLESLEEVFLKIDNIETDEINLVMQSLINHEKMSSLHFKSAINE